MIAASRSSAEGATPGVEGPVQLSAETLWTEVSARLKEELSDGPYAQWFTGASSALEDDVFVLFLRDDFTREWVDGHYRGLVEHAVSAVFDGSRPVRIVAAESSRRPEELEPPPRGVEGLNHKYTFDSFVIGSSNRFAHAAALAVAEAPAQAYNPLFIYGGTGLGKTHLLQAIASYVGEHSRHFSVRYVTSETFMNDFINSLRDKRIEGFKQRYRHYDLLLIDDIQFFEHKERIQE